MSKITAADVNKLRQMTGSGMMDCKNALVESEGDINKAVEILRKKGQKVAAKRGDREAGEGLVVSLSSDDGKRGVISVLSCETDFVAKNEEFGIVANTIAKIAMDSGVSSIDELKTKSFDGNGLTIGDKIMEMVGKIGEKIDVTAFDIIEADRVVSYNHPGNQVASLVGLNKDSDTSADAGRDVAMQIAAMNPVALDKDDVPQEVVDKEIEIGKELARKEGKPEEMLDKIASGRLNKFFKESTLLNQDFIKENKLSVSKYLNQVENGLTVTAFKRHSLQS